MTIKSNYSLKKHNAFGVDVKAKYFAEIKSEKDLKELLDNPKIKGEKILVLGEGSGTFITKDFNGLVIKNAIKGIEIIKEDSLAVQLKVGAGVVWNDLVIHAVGSNLHGIENMSMIPGTVGAAPVHNIAAYGQNFEDVFEGLTAIDLKTKKVKRFTKNACYFSYRSSIFKTKKKGKYFITHVTLKLKRVDEGNLSYHSRYESLEDELSKFATPPYTISDISCAVSNIRKRKFPDWKKFGNTGSFFLNPVITKTKLKEIQKKYPKVQYYPVDKLTYPKADELTFDHSKHVKIAAGWLLQELGWKGKRIGKVGTSPNQSMVIVNWDNASAKEILDFSKKMQADFKKHLGINLEPEVNIV